MRRKGTKYGRANDGIGEKRDLGKGRSKRRWIECLKCDFFSDVQKKGKKIGRRGR